jgi:hypothetical protein
MRAYIWKRPVRFSELPVLQALFPRNKHLRDNSQPAQVYKLVSPEAYKKVFTVKPLFLTRFSDFINRDFFDPSAAGEDKLNEFLQKNNVFMEKPVDGHAGSGVRKVTASEIKDLPQYYEYLRRNRLFLDGYIIQHPEISKICGESVNTIRIMTDSTNGVPKIVFAGMRIGNGYDHVDNFHRGGMCVAVDIETGTLSETAYDKDLNEYKSHPVTGFVFKGFKLPNWETVKKTVLKAALIEPRIMFIGWGVAITEHGMTFVEANRRPGFDLCQVALQRGCKYMMKNACNALKARGHKAAGAKNPEHPEISR